VVELAKTILDSIATDESVNRICQEEGMPEKGTFLRWLIVGEWRQILPRALDRLGASYSY
jgi:hypothetical protein